MIRIDGSVIRLEGHCPVEEAEQLLELLQGGASVSLDLGECRSVHTAVLQLLLASGAPVATAPADDLLAGLLTAACGLKSVAGPPAGRPE
ncbi:MAG TPA: hypothetical protein VGE72_29165 [Azospirillum sp.]